MAENIFETRTVTMSSDSIVAGQNLSIPAVSAWIGVAPVDIHGR